MHNYIYMFSLYLYAYVAIYICSYVAIDQLKFESVNVIQYSPLWFNALVFFSYMRSVFAYAYYVRRSH